MWVLGILMCWGGETPPCRPHACIFNERAIRYAFGKYNAMHGSRYNEPPRANIDSRLRKRFAELGCSKNLFPYPDLSPRHPNGPSAYTDGPARAARDLLRNWCFRSEAGWECGD